MTRHTRWSNCCCQKHTKFYKLCSIHYKYRVGKKYFPPPPFYLLNFSNRFDPASGKVLTDRNYLLKYQRFKICPKDEGNEGGPSKSRKYPDCVVHKVEVHDKRKDMVLFGGLYSTLFKKAACQG